MLAFVANTSVLWESVMNIPNGKEMDRAQDPQTAAKSAGTAPRRGERFGLAGAARAEEKRAIQEDRRSRFITALLRALSVWTA